MSSQAAQNASSLRSLPIGPFGPVGDGVADDTTALQNAINTGITNNQPVVFPAGTFKITSPLYIWRNQGVSSFVTAEIIGATPGETNTGQAQTIIKPNFVDKPAVIIQGARGVRLANIIIEGGNNFSSSIGIDYNVLITESTYVTGSCRDSRYSPHCCVAIDPFVPAVPADGGYPGLTAYYQANVQQSSHVEFDNCAFLYGIAGVIGLGPGQSNTDMVWFRNCTFQYNKVHVALGHDQMKSWDISACHMFGALTCIDGVSYGDQIGVSPSIHGLNIGGCKFIFNIKNDRWAQAFSGIYAESFLSIGYFGSTVSVAASSVAFLGCHFAFYTPTTALSVDAHLMSFLATTFVGCEFTTNTPTASLPIRILKDAKAPIKFTGGQIYCYNTNEPQLSITTGNQSPAAWPLIDFDHCLIGDGLGSSNPSLFSNRSNGQRTQSDYSSNVIPYGAEVRDANDPGKTWLSSSLVKQVSLGNIAVTVSGNTATFTASDATILKAGDVIYATGLSFRQPSGSVSGSVWGALGVISNINGTTITLSGIPENSGSATYALYLQWWARQHIGTTGDTSTSTSIANVTNPTLWKINTRISGSGIVAGTYITNIVGSTFTLSKATTQTNVGQRIYDADMYSLTGTAV